MRNNKHAINSQFFRPFVKIPSFSEVLPSFDPLSGLRNRLSMKSLDQLVVVLPCHTLEDFPVRHDEQNAKSLLAAWTALWHPSLISHAKQMPQWVSSDFVTCDFDNTLVLAPLACAEQLPLEITDAVEVGQSVIISGFAERAEFLSHDTFRKWIDPELDIELVRDFFALGYAYLQVQLLTRQLRYSTSINTTDFEEAVVAAALAVSKKDVPNATDGLQHCFDLIAQERSNYYPTDPNLLELVLLTDSTIDKRVSKQLQCNQHTNWLLTQQLHKQIQEQLPEDCAVLDRRLQDGSVCVVGGVNFEVPSNLVAIESLSDQIAKGRDHFSSRGIAVQTFASRMHNIGPHLPQVLTQFGYSSAIHASFPGGDIPTNCAPVMNWQGNDATNVSSLAATPLDAASASTFLALSITIGEILDSYHHCPLLLVHWPGRTSEYMDDMLRVLKYAPIFGDFTTFNSFNESIYDNGFSESYEADDYRFPWLKTIHADNQSNPVSQFVRYWRCHQRIRTLQNLFCIWEILEPKSDYSSQLKRLDELQNLNDQSLVEHKNDEQIVAQIESFRESEESFQLSDNSILTGDAGAAVINATTIHTEIETHIDGTTNAVRCSPFSFSTLERSTGLIRPKDPNVVTNDENTGLTMLRNEFFEVRFSESTGGIRSVNRHDKKGNLFSQQLAIRSSETFHQHGFPRERFQYSVPHLQSLAVSNQCKSSATVRSEIRLDDEQGNELAVIEQHVTVRRASRRIEFVILVRSVCEFSGPVWNNYLCSRIALPDKELTWSRSDHESRVPIANDKIIAPQFIEIVQQKHSKLTLLSGGLPFHRRTVDRKLDTLLVVEREQERKFEFAITIDSPTSAAAAKAYLSPTVVLPPESPYAKRNGWIFSLSCKNVMVMRLQPKYGENGNTVGVVMRLMETEGRSGELKIRFPFPLQSASKTNFLGEKISNLDLEGDQITCNFCENQYFQLECSW